jgi:peptidoglycan/LPS O-acetylase OafA/YrhL
VDDSAVSFQLIKHNILRNFGLLYPDVPGAFNSLPYATLNGAMWTISYEFRCYLAVVFVGVIGWLFGLAPTRSRWIILAFVLAGITVNGLGLLNGLAGFHEGIIGSPEKNCRLFSVFGVGSLFYMFRERIMLTDYGAIGAAVFLLILLFNRYTAEAGIALFGGYLIFWFALKYKVLRISVADNKNDISYGLYLYAWPIQNLIIWNERTIDPWVLCLITLIGAGLAGYVSWHFIEKRANALARRGQPPVAPRVMRGPTPDHQTRFDTDYL